MYMFVHFAQLKRLSNFFQLPLGTYAPRPPLVAPMTAIRVSSSLDSFKRHLKTHYFASP